jgi:hypothetical protein
VSLHDPELPSEHLSHCCSAPDHRNWQPFRFVAVSAIIAAGSAIAYVDLWFETENNIKGELAVPKAYQDMIGDSPFMRRHT